MKAHYLRNDQIELAVLPEYGCYWNTLRICLRGKWANLLEPIPDEKPPFKFGSYMMAPWSNRIVQGAFEFEGKRYQLRKNFPDETAIHGDVRSRPWAIQVARDTKFEATLDSRQFPDFNYPFALKFKHTLELSENHLSVALFIENVDRTNVPVGLGFHPFFKRHLGPEDKDVMVLLPADRVYPDEKCIPTGPAEPVFGVTDLRYRRFLGNPNLDHCFTALTGNLIRLIYPGSQVEVHYQIDSIFTHVVIYAPRDYEGKAKDFVAVEPVTHVNNGFNLYAKGWQGTGIKILKPGEFWGGTCKLSIVDLYRL
ncbi:MAG: hypothetical protein A3A81_02050 [Omnitrophica bacterium RIFCSPLOWO2_01_FULL_45_10b]|nr:MAG: hypothetical protein A3A81_02050 [Omnitrophica bacterium RIFCSPLOWO2_01_FULL_45_10b]